MSSLCADECLPEKASMLFICATALALIIGCVLGLCNHLQDRANWQFRSWIGVSLVSVCLSAAILTFAGPMGLLRALPKSTHFPLAGLSGVVFTNGEIFTASSIYHRIQVYDLSGQYQRGWFFEGTANGPIHLRLTEGGIIDVISRDRLEKFDVQGQLVASHPLAEAYVHNWADDADMIATARDGKTAEILSGWLFPKIIVYDVRKGRNLSLTSAWWALPWLSPWHALTLLMLGTFILTRKRKRRDRRQAKEAASAG